ncbi:MAG: sodium:alanine symporter family protein [Lachnospiraceae bacterium]|nr:sodium:alanine symporter family protein [Lachnospiraceae bacterium]
MVILNRLNDFLWSLPLLLLLMGTHIYFTCKLRFPQKHLWYAIRLSMGKADNTGQNLSPFSALATTLAATLGTGNIIGVSTAVALGGPGAIFWCWITGILGMATAYSECYLSVLFRRRREDGTYVGGPMYVLKNGLHNNFLGCVYAVCTLAAAFGVGCTTQANSVTQAASATFHISPHLVGIVLAFLTGTVILGGVKSIANICERMVPAISFVYLFGCLLLLLLYHRQLPATFALILKDAFSFASVAGGVAGGALQHAVRYGIARGLFTNEAGIGTSAIAAAASHAPNPRIQAYVSMTAVFWDTVVMCLITGLVIVANMLYDPASAAGVAQTDLTAAAFSHLPYVGNAFLTVSLAAFAVTTLIGWSYFGEKATEYLCGNKGIPCYKLAYILMIYFGAIIPMNLVWECTDLINALMVLPNVLALYLLRDHIKP